jgi:predicted phosphodiesterase
MLKTKVKTLVTCRVDATKSASESRRGFNYDARGREIPRRPLFYLHDHSRKQNLASNNETTHKNYRSMPRIIAIGDVHGCADEFEELLEALELEPKDRVIQVGDLINRGPDSHRVLKLAREYKVEAILGNHELRLLTARNKNRPELLKDYDFNTIEQLNNKDWAFLENLPAHKHLKSMNTVIVHGGFLPNQPWHSQPLEITTKIQVIDNQGRAAKRSDAPDAAPWADSWAGSPFVIYGHTPRANVLARYGSIGIDTGCVYGGHLTAYILEENSLVQVRARKTYAHSKRLPDPV